MTTTSRWLVTRPMRPLARRLTGRSARVLMYHRFAAHREPRKLGAAAFEQQVRYLRRHFEPCRLDVLVHRMKKGGPPTVRPSVTITVDDGYVDFLDVAYPILKRHDVPATVFVVTRFADQAIWLWFDALHHLAHSARAGRYHVVIAGNEMAIRLGSVAERDGAWEAIADACLALEASARPDAIRAVQETFDLPLPAAPTDRYRAMTWDELRRLDPGLIEIGAHTCTHPVLSQCSPEELELEVTESKRTIERQLGRPVRSFCYPVGRPGDYDSGVIAAVQRAGYEGAVVAHGTLVERGASLLALERSAAPVEFQEFQHVVDGFRHLSYRLKGRLGGQRRAAS